MLPMSSAPVRGRLAAVMGKLHLPTELDYPAAELWDTMSHDKKKSGSVFNVVFVDKIGSFDIRKLSEKELYSMLEEALTK